MLSLCWTQRMCGLWAPVSAAQALRDLQCALWGIGSPVGASGDDLPREPALATFSSSSLLRPTSSHLRSQRFYLPITTTTEVLYTMPDTCELVKRAPPPKAICPLPEPQAPWSAGSEYPVPRAWPAAHLGRDVLEAHSSTMPLSCSWEHGVTTCLFPTRSRMLAQSEGRQELTTPPLGH